MWGCWVLKNITWKMGVSSPSTVQQPARSIVATWSGGTWVMTSTSPFTSEVTRVTSSGIDRYVMRSTGAASPQKPSKRSTTTRSPGTNSVTRYGPVPTGIRPKPS